MRFAGLGRVLFGLSFAAIGALIIGFHDFAVAWRVLPKAIAWHDQLVLASGAILLVGGLGLLVPRTARVSALSLAGFLLVREFLLQMPHVVAHPQLELTWYDVCENLLLIGGAWTIFSMRPPDDGMLAKLGNARAGQILFGLALPAIGLSHFFYLNMTTPLIPSWLPFHVPLAYLTGAAHIAAGLGIVFGVLPRLAATLEAVMVSLFTLLVWVPIIVAAPTNFGNWSEFCVSTAISGAAWAVADSFRGRSWAWRASLKS